MVANIMPPRVTPHDVGHDPGIVRSRRPLEAGENIPLHEFLGLLIVAGLEDF